MRATEWSSEDVQFLKENYWDSTYREIADELDMSVSVVSRKAKDDLGLPKKSEKSRVEYYHGASIDRVLYHLHHDAKMSVNKMSDCLGVSRKTLDRWFSDTDVYKRGRSEAEELKWEQMSEEEREQQVKAAHEATFEKFGDGGRIGAWTKNNPEKHAEIARKAAPLGAPAREVNGMAGVTGQDHHSWRGGKHLIDAIRKQLQPSWWVVRDDARADECYKCGVSEVKLDVHHIIPLSAGGTNEEWNLMTLCESCHKTVEEYMRQYPGFDPVLME